jgi:hypothetical protein
MRIINELRKDVLGTCLLFIAVLLLGLLIYGWQTHNIELVKWAYISGLMMTLPVGLWMSK